MRQTIKKLTKAVSPPAPATVSASPSATLGTAGDQAANAVADGVASKAKKVVNKTIDDVKMTPFLRKITFFSSGGSFLDGYVLAIIGVALTQITPLFNLDTMWSAAVGASVFLGIFFGTIFGGWLTDLVGRRVMFIIDVLAIGVFSVFSMFASDPLQLVLARFVIGVFVGADYPIATSLIAEFTPKAHRSISMGMVSAAWYLGATAAAFVGYALFSVEGGWKWMLGSAVVPCIILLIGRHDIPESPLWLKSKGRHEEARAIIDRVFGEDVELIEPEANTKTSLKLIFKGG